MAESKKNIWNELYQAAAALRDANPWKVLTPKDLFGIEESESKEIYFCAFAESKKEDSLFKGLTGYQGAAGLEFYQRIAQDDVDMLHMLWAQQGFQVQYVSRKEISDEVYEQIKASEIVCKGKTSWPLFSAFSSGNAENTLGEAEGEKVLVVLQQVLALVEELKKDKKKQLLGKPEENCRYLIRRQEEKAWKNCHEYPPAVESPKALSFTKKELEKLGEKAIGSTSWDLDGFYWPSLPQVTKEGIRLPFIWAIGDRVKGTPLGMVVGYKNEPWKEGKAFLLNELNKFEEYPARIAVKRPELVQWLNPILKSLGIELLLVQEVPAMIRIREELRNEEDELGAQAN